MQLLIPFPSIVSSLLFKSSVFLLTMSDVNRSTYGDIYKREKCLLVASVHDLLARGDVLLSQMLLNVILFPY